MRKKWICFFLLLFIITSTSGCRSTNEIVAFNHNSKVQTPISTSAEEQIRDENYHKDGIEASYPRFVVGGSEEQRDLWNDLIEVDFNKIIHIYSFNPFPDLTPSPTAVVPTILKINYVIKANNNNVVSIFYTADFNSPYSAHPTDLVYTTNIDKVDNKRLKLSDIIKINSDFVKSLRGWDFISVEEGNEELNQAIRDYINNISDEDLLMGLEAADQINSNNIWGIYSYLTTDKLGISIAVPNYIGDHVEFEREFSELKDFLVSGFERE